MKLHFVCTGNVFRSRLAEAYARYLLKNHPHYQISSSGVDASNGLDGPIAWYALKLIDDHDLIPYISPIWTQTTAELLADQDKIIFMQPEHLAQSQTRFNYHNNNHLVWDIADITPNLTDDEIIAFSEKQFELIKHHVDQLITQLLL